MLPEQYDCFLSYRDTDKGKAEVIYNRLKDVGFKVWWDKVYLEAGMRWHEEIEQHCENSRVVVPLLTPAWKNSVWTRFETYGAERIIPVVLYGEWQEVATPPLALLQRDLINVATATEGDWQRLLDRIRHYVHEPRPVRGEKRRPTLLKHRPIVHFVGRDQTLVELHEQLFLDSRTALTPGGVIAIPALGGVGKTTLARHYAEKFWRCYRQMFWVDCRTGIEAGFAEIHDLLHPGHEQAVPTDIRAKRALHDLEQPASEQSLLIIDNAEDEESILPWIPKAGDCHVLITSRFTAWSNEVAKHEVWVLDPRSAKELLLKVSGRAEDEAADGVAEKLQFLPLALEQAAAYVAEQTGFGFQDYLRLYRANEKAFLDRKARGVTNYPDSVYLTWRTTVDKLPEGARAMLRLHAFFAATPFPVSLYIAGAAKLAEEIGTDAIPDELAVREWKSSLVRYSMARAEPEDCISVHALVQAVERHAMGARAHEVARRSAEMYCSAAPKPSWEWKNRTFWAGLVSHSRALAVCEFVGDDLRLALYGELVQVFRFGAFYGEGVDAARRTLEICDRFLGPDHPNTASSVNNLAALLRDQGDYIAAEPLYRRAVEDCERVMGREHPSTLSSINNLAGLLQSQGRYGEAEPLFRRAVESGTRILGSEHPLTLSWVSNLALLLYDRGDYKAAEPLCRSALEAKERVLGSEHPETINSINNLAGMLRAIGNFDQAEPLCQRALTASERILGPDHPQTLTALNNLAPIHYFRGDYAAAESLLRRALEIRERVLGSEHPATLESINNLAGPLVRTGRYAEAESLVRRALEAQERVLGFEHPGTLTSVNNLAVLLETKGEYLAAQLLFRRALESLTKVSGRDHPNTRAAAANLQRCIDSMHQSPA